MVHQERSTAAQELKRKRLNKAKQLQFQNLRGKNNGT